MLLRTFKIRFVIKARDWIAKIVPSADLNIKGGERRFITCLQALKGYCG